MITINLQGTSYTLKQSDIELADKLYSEHIHLLNELGLHALSELLEFKLIEATENEKISFFLEEN